MKLPSPIGDASGTVLDDSLLVFGGGAGDGFSADILAVCPSRSSVARVGTMPYAARGHQIVDLGDGTVLMIGGFDGNTRNDVHIIDLADFSARRLAPCPGSIAWFAAAPWAGKVVIIGGFTIPDGYLSSVMTYDIALDRWETEAEAIPSGLFPKGAFGANVLIEHRNRLLSLGGADSFDGGHAKTLGTVAAFEPESRTWHADFEPIHSREGIAAARSGDDLFLIGGISEGSETASPLIEILDINAGKIRGTGSLTVGRLTPVAGIVGDNLVVAGGVVRPLNEMTDTIEVMGLDTFR